MALRKSTSFFKQLTSYFTSCFNCFKKPATNDGDETSPIIAETSAANPSINTSDENTLQTGYGSTSASRAETSAPSDPIKIHNKAPRVFGIGRGRSTSFGSDASSSLNTPYGSYNNRVFTASESPPSDRTSNHSDAIEEDTSPYKPSNVAKFYDAIENPDVVSTWQDHRSSLSSPQRPDDPTSIVSEWKVTGTVKNPFSKNY